MGPIGDDMLGDAHLPFGPSSTVDEESSGTSWLTFDGLIDALMRTRGWRWDHDILKEIFTLMEEDTRGVIAYTMGATDRERKVRVAEAMSYFTTDLDEREKHVSIVFAPLTEAAAVSRELGYKYFVIVEGSEITESGTVLPEEPLPSVDDLIPDGATGTGVGSFLADAIIDSYYETTDAAEEAPEPPDSYHLTSEVSNNPALGILESSVIAIDATKFVQNQYIEDQGDNLISFGKANSLNRIGVTNYRPKIIMQNTYKESSNNFKGLDKINAKHTIDSALAFNIIKQDNTINFVKKISETNPDLFTELIENSELKKQRLYNSIEFIKQIDIYKQSFSDSLQDYKTLGLDYLGYNEDLNVTYSIRKMYQDMSMSPRLGGLYLYHFTNGMMIDNEGSMASNTEQLPRTLRTDFSQYTKVPAAHKILLQKEALVDHPKINLNQVGYIESISGLGYNTDGLGALASEYANLNPPLTFPILNSEYQHNFYVLGRNTLPMYFQTMNQGQLTGDGLFSTRYCNIAESSKFIQTLKARYSQNKAAVATHMCQTVYLELMMSYIIGNSPLTKAAALKKYNKADILGEELGDAIADPEQKIESLDNSKKLAQILKFDISGKSVYPFAEPGSLTSTKDGMLKSGTESWIDSNIGNVFEKRDLNFSELDQWIEKFSALHETAKNKIKPFSIDGNAQIVYNEILRALKGWADGSVTELSPQMLAQVPENKRISFDEAPGHFANYLHTAAQEHWVLGTVPYEDTYELADDTGDAAKVAQTQTAQTDAETKQVAETATAAGSYAEYTAEGTTVSHDDDNPGTVTYEDGDFDFEVLGGVGTERGGDSGTSGVDMPDQGSNGGTEEVITDFHNTTLASQLPVFQLLTPDVDLISANNNIFTKKMLFAFHLLKNINLTKDPEVFWYFAYQSTQFGIPFADKSFMKRIISVITGREPENCSMLIGDFVPAIAHALEIISGICSEIEKNIYYDIATLAKDSGFTTQSPGPYSSEGASRLANIIFDSNSLDEIYRHRTQYEGNVCQPDEASHASSMKHFQIRGMLLVAMQSISEKILSNLNGAGEMTAKYVASNFTDPIGGASGDGRIYMDIVQDPTICRAEISKVFLPIVENLDPDKGPVRWKITHGSWQASGYELETSDFVLSQVVPEYAREIIDTGEIQSFDLADPTDNFKFQQKYGLMKTTEIAGKTLFGSRINPKDFVSEVANHFSFISKQEDFVPYTFVDNSEVPKNSFETSPLRGAMSGFIKACIYQQEDVRRYLAYLDNLIEKFKSINLEITSLEELANSENFFEIAKLIGIEIAEVAEFSSLRQTFLREYIASEEIARTAGYLPSNSTIGHSVRKLFVEGIYDEIAAPTAGRWLRSEWSDAKVQEGKIVTVGLPAGLIDNQVSKQNSDFYPTVNRIIRIDQSVTSILSNIQFKPIKRYYWPALFINNASFAKNYKPGNKAYESINYGYIDKDTFKYKTTDFNGILVKLTKIITESAISEPNMTTEELVVEIIKNHYNDFALKSYLNLYAGLNLDETSFSLNRESNVLYVDQIALDNIDLFLTNLSVPSADSFLKENRVISFNEYFKNSKTNDRAAAYETYSSFCALIQSRLFSSDQMTTKVITPNIFDRVFSFYTHIGELSLDQDHFKKVTEGKQDLKDVFIEAADDLFVYNQAERGGESNNMTNDFNVEIHVACKTLQPDRG